jgi:hypothetical protein
MAWAADQCPFYYSSHYTPTLTANITGLAAFNATAPLRLGTTGLGSDASRVAISVLDEKLGEFPATVTAVSTSGMDFQAGVQVFGSAKKLRVRAEGLGDAMVAQAGGPMLPTINVRCLRIILSTRLQWRAIRCPRKHLQEGPHARIVAESAARIAYSQLIELGPGTSHLREHACRCR